MRDQRLLAIPGILVTMHAGVRGPVLAWEERRRATPRQGVVVYELKAGRLGYHATGNEVRVDSTRSRPRYTGTRCHPRQPVTARVTRYDGTPSYWTSIDLSAGGIAVCGEPVLPRHTELEIGVWLPDPSGSIEVVATVQVVWSSDPQSAGHQADRKASMGMKFVDLDDGDARLLADYLAHVGAPPAPLALQVPVKSTVADAPLAGHANTPLPLADEEWMPLGTTLGSYEVLARLGAGGMGNVYVARHVSLGRLVALKRLHTRYATDPLSVRRFFDEARLVNEVSHDNIVEVTDFTSQGTAHYYVMELLEGTCLSDLLYPGEPMALPRVLRIAIQLCDALDAVHAAGVVHRDLKPGNVFLVERAGRSDFVKLLDFGIAKLRDSALRDPDQRTATGISLGTPGYMAPEQFLGQDVDGRADIYALGVLLFQMVGGKKPFVANSWPGMMLEQVSGTPPKLTTGQPIDLPRKLELLIQQCLERDPDQRPQSAAEIGSRLRAIECDLGRASHRTAVTRGLRLGLVVAGAAGLAAIVSLVGLRSTGTRVSGAPSGAESAGRVPASPLPAIPTAVERPRGTTRRLARRPPLGSARSLASDKVPARQASSVTRSVASVLTPRAATPASRVTRPATTTGAQPAASPVTRPQAPAASSARVADEARPAALPAGRPMLATDETSSQNPDHDAAQHQYERGRALLRDQKALLAIAALRRCLAADPNHALAYRSIGEAYALLGRDAQAIEAFESFVRLAPGHSDADRLRRLIADFRGR